MQKFNCFNVKHNQRSSQKTQRQEQANSTQHWLIDLNLLIQSGRTWCGATVLPTEPLYQPNAQLTKHI